MASIKAEIHMHSNFSDGEFSPAQLVDIGRKNGVDALSLTDHDTFTGMDEFITAAKETDIFAFPGIEITVQYHDFNLHLLGYFKSLESLRPELRDRVEQMRQQREDRMRELIDRVDSKIPDRFRGTLTLENVQKAAEGVLARPHLAREMVRLGIVDSVQDAFDLYLVKYNIEKKNLQVDEAIQLIRESNGVPVCAHPGERNYSLCNPDKGRAFSDVEKYVLELKSMGLLGLECVYPYHEKTGKVKYFLDLADKHGLIATGSRDFHGFHYSQGAKVLGTTKMPEDFLDRFRAVWG